MTSKFNLVKKIILFFIGMSIIQFGVALYLKANIGSDPFTVFTQGLAFLLNVTPGIANMIILFTLFFIILFVEKTYINVGTFICVFGVGPIIDLGMKTVSYFHIENTSLFVKILIVILGCVVVAVGFSILSASELGVAPNDIIPFIIKDKTKLEYRWVRMGLDAMFLCMGFILGGVCGIGTVIAVFLTGPVIQFFLPYGEKLAKSLIQQECKTSI